MRRIGEFLLARDGHAAFVAMLCALLPLVGLPFGFLGVVILALVTLARGPRSGFFVLAWIALPALAFLFLHQFNELDTLLADAITVWILAYCLRRYGSWTFVFQIATLVGVLVVLLMHLLFPDVQAWWAGHFTQYLEDIKTNLSLEIAPEQSAKVIKLLSPFASGMFVLIGLFWTWLLLLLARRWQRSIRHQPYDNQFILVRNRWPVVLLLALGVVGVFLKQPLVTDIFPVLLFPLMMGGLSVVHYFIGKRKGFSVLYALVYLVLVLFLQWAVLLLVLIGLVDTAMNLRRFMPARLTKNGP